MTSPHDLHDYSLQQIADAMRARLQRYIEASYHIRDREVVEERRALLSEAGTIAQRPYIETTPTYELGPAYSGLGLPEPVGSTLEKLAGWQPSIGVYPRPYAHQAEALRGFFSDRRDIVVATGTGSGKTETFLFPIMGQLLLEASSRPASWRMPGCRALLLYPMNALVSDQLARLRRLFGDERLAGLFRQRYGRHPLFGMYTSRTPYPGLRASDHDRRHLDPLLRYYLDLDSPGASEDAIRRGQLVKELRARGRWPAKDLRGFFGEPGGRWDTRLRTQSGDRELLTRHEMQQHCPDMLVTNYSMLEYMLMRPIERGIFQQTRDWLASDPANEIILVVDEAHMYRGTGGAEVALLIRRLQARLGIPRERMRCILTSASFGDGPMVEQDAVAFAEGLTGRLRAEERVFRFVRGIRESRPSSRPGTIGEAQALAQLDRPAFFARAERPMDAGRAISDLAAAMNWPTIEASADSEELRRYLYEQLHGFGPIELLIGRTAGNATALVDLAAALFPDADETDAQSAIETLLALGTYANNGERPLLPTRVHLFFRGLPPIYACVNTRCDYRRHRSDEALLLGRLYTEPRTHCTCGARVYEVLAHRDCGAVFLRAFGQTRAADFYWHEPGGTIEGIGERLEESWLLVGDPHRDLMTRVEPIWLDIATGRATTTPPEQQAGYRQLWRPAVPQGRPRGATKTDEADDDAAHQALPFSKCPSCDGSGKKITDLATKGERPFANLVHQQLALQPSVHPPSAQLPNGGRKVLLFSDGRQKAARLARDLPREVEFDTFRQAIVLAAHRLQQLGQEPTLDRRLYTAFVSVCHDQHLHFFDNSQDNAQSLLLSHIEKYRRDYEADLEIALGDEFDEQPPLGYRLALLDQVCNPFYSSYAIASMVVRPSKVKLSQLDRRLVALDALRQQLGDIAIIWIWHMLDKGAFDPMITALQRKTMLFFPKAVPLNPKLAKFEERLRVGGLSEQQVQALRSEIPAILAEQSGDNQLYLKPSALRLELAFDRTWFRCRTCHLVWHAPLFGRCCGCGSAELEELPPEHPYPSARYDYFRAPLRDVIRGLRPVHVTAEEHTAQLAHRDTGAVYATTEEFELRFQDITLGPQKPPIDVLSCTTTMEVGIDIGSLTAIGMRNVPPQRENYQQRTGRAGRRGAAVSTVLTYAQGGAHDSYYYHQPAAIISGPPRSPVLSIDNLRLAARHVNAHLIQSFFHEQLDALGPARERQIIAERKSLAAALGTIEEFFSASGPLTIGEFAHWLSDRVLRDQNQLTNSIAAWLPNEGFAGERRIDDAKHIFVRATAERLLSDLRAIKDADSGTPPVPSAQPTVGNLLDALFDKGLLPSYAFPTDLVTFYVFDREGDRVIVRERPQQSKARALSEYAPGRLLVVNKQTYQVGGIYDETIRSSRPAESWFVQTLPTYVACPACTYVRLDPAQSGELCPICREALETRQYLDPPGFSPAGARPVGRLEDEDIYSQATSAQFPTPVQPDRLAWRTDGGCNLLHAWQQNELLVIVNKGPDDEGFSICQSCGAAWPATNKPNNRTHERPFLLTSYQQGGDGHRCAGQIRDGIYLGTTFRTDLLLLRVPIRHPLAYSPGDPWLHDALRTTAEAVTLAACRLLDVDPAELSAGYRLVPADASGADDALACADIYLYDTASGGAGYSAETGQAIGAVLTAALKLVEACVADCDRSCQQCLCHYGNRFWHKRLDRRLARQLLQYIVRGTTPLIDTVEHQRRLLRPLRRYLELEGWHVQSTQSDADVPLLVSPPRQERRIAVGTYPALLDLDRANAPHPIVEVARRQGATCSLLPDYVVERDLPAAYRMLLGPVGR